MAQHRPDIRPRPAAIFRGTIAGMREHAMYVVHDGPHDAPVVLLVHGSGVAGATWGPVVPALAERYHVIRLDLPGCGQSAPAPSYAVPAQARQVAALLDGLGLRDVVAAGHSSGGYVVTSLAEQRPDLVRSLAMISCGPSPDAFLPQPLILRLLLAPPIGPLLWARRTDAMTRKGFNATTAHPVEMPDDLVAAMRGTTYGVMRAVLRGNAAYVAERNVPERLADLGLPVLAVFGGADPRWDPASAQRYETVPGARVERLAGVGHVPMLEAPARTAALIGDFAAATTGIPPVVPET